MADVAEPTERVILPLPPPLQGALTAGPYNFQFTGEDNLRLTVANALAGVVIAVHFRTAPTPTTTQTNREFHIPTSDRLLTTKEFAVGTGYLLNAVVFAAAGAPKRCQTWVKLEVIRGLGANAVVLGALVQGHATANQVLAYPGSPMEASTDGDGYVRFISGTQPGPGLEYAELVPTNARWELLTWRAQLITSSQAANRRPGLLFEDPLNPYYRSPGTLVAIASTTTDHYWAEGSAFLTAILPDVSVNVLPAGYTLSAGHRIRSATNALQTLDQYQTPFYSVRERLEV